MKHPIVLFFEGMFLMLIFPVVLFAGQQRDALMGSDETVFDSNVLNAPRHHRETLLQPFSYNETDLFVMPSDSLFVFLENGYAKSRIINKGDYSFDSESFRVQKIDIVFTRYPYHKEDWLTNYYELLAARLRALFEIDSTLNTEAIEWGLVLQTYGKTGASAKALRHGIAIWLEPVEETLVELPAEDSVTGKTFPAPIENQGFITREERNHDFFRSRIQFEPDPEREPRQNMKPPDLKCPRWR